MKSVEFFCCSKRDLIRLQKYCTVQYFTTVQQKSFITIDDKSSYRYQERDFYVFFIGYALDDLKLFIGIYNLYIWTEIRLKAGQKLERVHTWVLQ